MFKRNETKEVQPLLSAAFMAFVDHLSPIERVICMAKRRESVQEFFRNRSSTI